MRKVLSDAYIMIKEWDCWWIADKRYGYWVRPKVVGELYLEINTSPGPMHRYLFCNCVSFVL